MICSLTEWILVSILLDILFVLLLGIAYDLVVLIE